MTESMCRYAGDRDDALIALLYDDPGCRTPEQELFEAHVQTCARCRDELAALRSVRVQLSRWAPPEPGFAIAKLESAARSASIANPQSIAGPPSVVDPQSRTPESALRTPQWRAWREMPAWAQVAAALLFLGVSAGIANLDVRYDASGLSVRTGWSSRAPLTSSAQAPSKALAPSSSLSSAAPVASGSSAVAPWRADLMALEQQLKTEIRSAQASAHAVPAPTLVRQPVDPSGEIVRRVRALIEESEKRQKIELALRVGEVMRDVHAERRADLEKIDRTLYTVRSNLGVEVLKTQKQVDQMNILYRASQRQ